MKKLKIYKLFSVADQTKLVIINQTYEKICQSLSNNRKKLTAEKVKLIHSFR